MLPGHDGAVNDVHAGDLLLATAALDDPHFAASVVLLLDVADDGVLGVVINRPSGVAVSQVLGAWSDVVSPPEVLFRGGPVENDGALAVAVRRVGDGAAPVPGLRPVAGRLCLLDLDASPQRLDYELDGMRIFAGYAGWGAGQLEREIAEGSWHVAPALAGDLLRVDTTGLWRDVMRRQPGELAWLSTRPADPELN